MSSYILEASNLFLKGFLIGSLIYGIYYAIILRKESDDTFYIFTIYTLFVYLTSVLFVTRIVSSYGWKFDVGVLVLKPFADGFDIQNVLNIIMFIPLGFLLRCVSRDKWKLIWYIIIGFAFSILIESAQFFLCGRLADVTDVITNTFGNIIGVFMYSLVKSFWDKFHGERKFGKGTVCLLFLVFVLIIFTPYIAFRICIADMFICGILSTKIAWFGESDTALSFEGYHLTMIYGMIISFIIYLISKKHEEDFGGKLASKVSVAMVIYLFAFFVLNIII